MPVRKVPYDVDPYSVIPPDEDIKDIRVSADGLILTTVPKEEIQHSPPAFAPGDIITGEEAEAIISAAATEQPISSETPSFPILEGNVYEVSSFIESGQADGYLDALAQAESQGKNRKTVMAAIERRKAELEG